MQNDTTQFTSMQSSPFKFPCLFVERFDSVNVDYSKRTEWHTVDIEQK